MSFSGVHGVDQFYDNWGISDPSIAGDNPLVAPKDFARLDVKPFFGDLPARGGAVLQKLTGPFTKAMSDVHESMTSYFTISDTKKASITEQVTKLDRLSKTEAEDKLKQAMITGRRYRDMATFCNGLAILSGGLLGIGAGLFLWKVGGTAGAIAGVLGGCVVGAVCGYLCSEHCSEYLLRGLGIEKDSPQYENAKLFVTCSLGLVGGILGFAAGAVAGGALGAFVGQALLVGGLAKAGIGLFHFLSSSTVGAYFDSLGKAYEDAAMQGLEDKDFSAQGFFPPTILSRLEAMVTGVERSRSNESRFTAVESMTEMPDRVSMEIAGSPHTPTSYGRVGSMFQKSYESAANILRNPLKVLVSGEKEEVGPKRGLFTPEQWERFAGIEKAQFEGSLFFYGAGVALSSVALLGKMSLMISGTMVGAVGGMVLTGLHLPIVTAACVLGTVIEGAVTGGIVGYLFMLDRVAKVKEEDKSETTEKAVDLGTKAAALGFGLVGGLIGVASFSILQGGFGQFVDRSALITGAAKFIDKSALIGGGAKIGFLAAEALSGALFNDLYCLGCALEKRGASAAMRVQPQAPVGLPEEEGFF